LIISMNTVVPLCDPAVIAMPMPAHRPWAKFIKPAPTNTTAETVMP
jgi:hypothetical protein